MVNDNWTHREEKAAVYGEDTFVFQKLYGVHEEQ